MHIRSFKELRRLQCHLIFPPVGLWWCTNDDNRLNSSINELPVSLYDSTFTLLGSFEKCQCEQELKMQLLNLPLYQINWTTGGKTPFLQEEPAYPLRRCTGRRLEEGGVVGADGRGILKRHRVSGNTFGLTYILKWGREKKTRLTSRIWLDGRITSVAVVLNGKLCSSLLAREQIITVYYLLGCCWTKQCVT